MTTTVEAPPSPIFAATGPRETNERWAQPAAVLGLLTAAAQVWVVLEYFIRSDGPGDWSWFKWVTVLIRLGLAVLLVAGAAFVLTRRRGGGWFLVLGAAGTAAAFFLEPIALAYPFGDRFVTLFDSSMNVGILLASLLGLAAMVVGMLYAGKKETWTVVDIAVVVYALFPVVWMVSLSLKATPTLTDKSYLPREISLEHYETIFTKEFSLFLRPLINSIGISVIATLIAVVLGTMAAYAIARLDFPGKRALIGVSLLIAMFPQISLVSPLFEQERALG